MDADFPIPAMLMADTVKLTPVQLSSVLTRVALSSFSVVMKLSSVLPFSMFLCPRSQLVSSMCIEYPVIGTPLRVKGSFQIKVMFSFVECATCNLTTLPSIPTDFNVQ